MGGVVWAVVLELDVIGGGMIGNAGGVGVGVGIGAGVGFYENKKLDITIENFTIVGRF
jgi:hypothetical protein